MYGESLAETTCEPKFETLPGGIEQCRQTALTRVPMELVCPAMQQMLRHLMPFSVVDRNANAPDADLGVYHRTIEHDGYVYVNTASVKPAPKEDPMKAIRYDTAAECEAEYGAALQLLSKKVRL